MQTNKIEIGRDGSGREQALEETSKFDVYNDIDKKTAYHIRLLAEETLGMASAILGDYEAVFWLETTGDRVCELHLSAQSDMDYEKEKMLLAVSVTGENIAEKGFMGKIGRFIRRALFSMEEVEEIKMQYGYDPMMYGMTGMGDVDSAAMNSMIYMWSMSQYQDELKQNMEENQEAAEAWDELEKSIVASIADDVVVGIKGDKVELIIKKKY